MSEYNIAQVGPAGNVPCGIFDYAQLLHKQFSKRVSARYFSYQDALEVKDWKGFKAVYVHYERSLLPERSSLKTLGTKLADRGYLIPHEVYEEDPFAYPYHLVKSRWPLVHQIKRWLYRKSHAGFFEERKIQSQNYFFSNVIALSKTGAAILQKRGARPLIIPLAMTHAPEVYTYNSVQEIFREEKKDSAIWLGVFGFINPANDYKMLIDLLKELPQNYRLLLIGGDKGNASLLNEIFSMADKSGVLAKLRYTGYIPPEDVPGYLSGCSMFICPFKHKSNSSSVLNLFHYRKPVLGTNIAILQELKSNGAPLDLFENLSELLHKVKSYSEENQAIENNYPFSVERVCNDYLSMAGLNVNVNSK